MRSYNAEFKFDPFDEIDSDEDEDEENFPMFVLVVVELHLLSLHESDLAFFLVVLAALGSHLSLLVSCLANISGKNSS